MPLQILDAPSQSRDPGAIVAELERSILEAIPGAATAVTAVSPGHFEIRVVAEAFAGKGRVQQQQLVYGAIAHLMKGDAAPVHAIDRLQTETP
jgi:stress-induced morphogen